jgi:8-oxo-dGTP pyrophosphatase MutT (NUDIX family)
VTLALDDAWLARLHARADTPPLVPRAPLRAGDALVGSVEPDFFPKLKLPASLVREHAAGWQLQGEVTRTLHEVALAMRDAGLAHVWRDEQLAVTDNRGRTLGTVERAAVRPLGITTFAVHLAGFAPDGRHWVQQRSFDKANDPGLWDTLMGGLVPASDSLQRALERETWEEAGLRIAQVRELRHGGRVTTRRPSTDVPAGYVVEHIDWYRCVVPQGVVPANQDGEVQQFALLDPREVARKLLGDEFTLEAALVLTEFARQA